MVNNCPHDVHVHLNALEPYVNAKWIEPTFKDNIAVTHIIKSKVKLNPIEIRKHLVRSFEIFLIDSL